tara:strand:- start:1116 stop:1796 length:681 start_codon:yes stop_codon:yes gene_type:complete
MDGTNHSAALPARIPIFPLSGTLLLPEGRLPLNIFEPRYLEMVRDAMAGERIIGMVQPLTPEQLMQAPEVYPIGGAGRITAFQETDDGRMLITLTGIQRFRIAEELAVTTGYRQVIADWAPFAEDRAGIGDDSQVDRERLLMGLRAYLHVKDLKADWDSIEKAPSGALINYLSMLCPFEASEKQALLQAPEIVERSRIFVALLEMSVLQSSGAGGTAGNDNPSTPH